MVGPGRVEPVAEDAAEGEVARVYHEIRQVLRSTGVSLSFRTWAARPAFLVALWDELHENVETRAFEEAADHLRSEAVCIADRLGRLGAAGRVPLGECQQFAVRGALALYHYLNPKLLLFCATLRLALDGAPLGTSGPRDPRAEPIERGAPLGMHAMEMVDEAPDDPQLRALFAELRESLGQESLASDYRTLALWPEYLRAMWDGLRPHLANEGYRRGGAELAQVARSLARSLPYPVRLSRERVSHLGVDPDEATALTDRFELQLPPLLLNVALASLDWEEPERLARSPFPALPRRDVELGQGGYQ
jgi:hypothetical protein